MRLEVSPTRPMTMKVTRKVSGSDTSTTSAVRSSATKRKRITITRRPPSRSASMTVSDAGLDERGPVVEDVDARAGRQGGAGLVDGGLDALDHLLGVLALQHDDHAGHGLALAVAGHGALARLGADDHVGHVAQVDRRAVVGLQDHPLDVRDVLQQPHPAQVGLLPALHHHAAAGVAVGALQRLGHLAHREAVLHQPLRPDQHLVLLHVPAEAVHLVDARDRLEERRHDPVLDGPQLHRREAVALQRVLEDLAEAGGDGAELGVDARAAAPPGPPPAARRRSGASSRCRRRPRRPPPPATARPWRGSGPTSPAAGRAGAARWGS